MPRWLADNPELLQFCWDIMKPPRNDEIALQHFFSCLQQCKNFFLLHLCCMQFLFLPTSACRNFFFKIPPPPPQELNGRPLTEVKNDVNGRRQTAKITSEFEFFSSNP